MTRSFPWVHSGDLARSPLTVPSVGMTRSLLMVHSGLRGSLRACGPLYGNDSLSAKGPLYPDDSRRAYGPLRNYGSFT
jgi:hypothetical protein